MGVLYSLTAGSTELESILRQTPVSDVWGIGRRQSKKLNACGIYTVLQLRDMDLQHALRLLTVTGQRTVYELRGLPAIMEDTAPVPRETLVSSRSFGRGTTTYDDLAEALAMHASIAGERLRAEKILVSFMQVWCETSRHGEDPYHCISASLNFECPTNDTRELAKAAHTALRNCYQKGYRFMKGGLMLCNLSEEGTRQLTLMESVQHNKNSQNVMLALDTINKRYGRNTLRLASQGKEQAHWRMRRGRMSPCYTTKFSELPIARMK